MPGHKGKNRLGCEEYDITEIVGADNLFSPEGIIKESEKNAASLFGTAHTFYSAEGSTLAIKAMLATALSGSPRVKKKTVLAARNVHKSFIYAAAMLDFEVRWIQKGSGHLCEAEINVDTLKSALDSDCVFDAVYITSPDYLGNIYDIKAISKVCKERGIPLLVDNAHGAYLAFMSPSAHPIALGADMCCDSAHKTLPVLTGGAYLHVSKSASAKYLERARSMLALFASTSPSYLILQSLDLCNEYLASGYEERLRDTLLKIDATKQKLRESGIAVIDSEPLKITLHTSEFGYTGYEISEVLRSFGIEIEFFDEEYAVMMATPENTDCDFDVLVKALSSLEKRTKTESEKIDLLPHVACMSVRDAIFSPCETVLAKESLGRICASPTVSCPPAVPIVISGERIETSDVSLFKKHGISEIQVVKEM